MMVVYLVVIGDVLVGEGKVRRPCSASCLHYRGRHAPACMHPQGSLPNRCLIEGKAVAPHVPLWLPTG